MNEIKIANLLVTRKCNLACSYCRISGDINYRNRPPEYPDKKFYFENEVDTNQWLNCISLLKKHNPDIFLIIYGGEPFLRKDLIDIVKHCNNIGVNYTIISSCNQAIQPLIEKFFEELKPQVVKGFTASVDPGFYLDPNLKLDDKIHKSHLGFKTLVDLKNRRLIQDPVAEITASENNIEHLYHTISILSDLGITSDITMLDIAKNHYYDFSTITNEKYLVPKNDKVKKIIDSLINSNFRIHMKDQLLSKIYEILPANLDCKIEEKLHNISIEPNLEVRTCLRIRGINSPKYKLTDLLNNEGQIQRSVHNAIKTDKKNLCEGCFWSCMIMSQMDSNDIINH